MASRRQAGQAPYQPTAPRTAGFNFDPSTVELPEGFFRQQTRVLPAYRWYSDLPRLQLPAGCTLLALMAVADADIIVLEQLSDMDTRRDDPRLVHNSVSQSVSGIFEQAVTITIRLGAMKHSGSYSVM